MRDATFALLLSEQTDADIYAGSMRLLQSHWSAYVDFAGVQWSHRQNVGSGVGIRLWSLAAILGVTVTISAVVASAVLLFFFGPQASSIPSWSYPLLTGLFVLCALGSALHSIRLPSSNALGLILVNASVLSVAMMLGAGLIGAGDQLWAWLLFLPLGVVSLVWGGRLAGLRVSLAWDANQVARTVVHFLLGVAQSASQQASNILAHSLALALPGAAAATYFSERIVTVVPMLFLSTIISHDLSAFSAALSRDGPAGAHRCYRLQLRRTLAHGTIGLLSVAGISYAVLVMFPPPFFQIAGIEPLFWTLFAFMTVGCVCWLADMLALRLLGIWRYQHVGFGISLIALLVAFGCYLVTPLLTADVAIQVAITWTAPVVVRAVLSILAFEVLSCSARRRAG